MNDVPNLVKEHNGGKGAQLEYTLLPLADIEKVVLEVEKPMERIVQYIDDEIINDYEYKIEQLQLAKQAFNDLHTRVKCNQQVVTSRVLNEFNQLKIKTRNEESLVALKRALVDVSLYLA